MMRIIHEAEHYFAIDKPPGFFVHPPESSPYPVAKERVCLFHLEKKFGRSVFPVHRLDAPTSGIVVFARSREATRALSMKFMNREIEKTYLAVARGYVEDEGSIELPLESKGESIPAETEYSRLAKVELPFPVGRYPTARYSLVEVRPVTGRWHQIRRHFDRISHPIIGDIEHGDSHHNRFFRDRLGINGLCLRATRLVFADPWSGTMIELRAPSCEKWQRIHSLFGGS